MVLFTPLIVHHFGHIQNSHTNFFGSSTCKSYSITRMDRQSAKQAIKQRYNGNLNVNESVVSPLDLFESSIIEVVYSNY